MGLKTGDFPQLLGGPRPLTSAQIRGYVMLIRSRDQRQQERGITQPTAMSLLFHVTTNKSLEGDPSGWSLHFAEFGFASSNVCLSQLQM